MANRLYRGREKFCHGSRSAKYAHNTKLVLLIYSQNDEDLNSMSDDGRKAKRRLPPRSSKRFDNLNEVPLRLDIS